MIYFCADDYGISAECNQCIENCLNNGALNKTSVLPNGEITGLKKHLSSKEHLLSLHINLVEGKPLSELCEVNMLVNDKGFFKYSFIGLFFLSLSFKRKEVKKQLYNELKKQIGFWKDMVGEDYTISIDSHQHTHMIPLIFKTLMRVIKDEGIKVELIRIPDEPLLPYIMTPSLYLSYSLMGLIKQWLLKYFAFLNGKELKKTKIQTAYFMGVMFSGKLDEIKIKKILPHYLKLAKKSGKDIEIGFHPGYLENEEDLITGSRKDFSKFYLSGWRKTEYDTLMNLKIDEFIID